MQLIMHYTQNINKLLSNIISGNQLQYLMPFDCLYDYWKIFQQDFHHIPINFSILTQKTMRPGEHYLGNSI